MDDLPKMDCIEVPWYVENGEFVKLMKEVKDTVEEVNCSKASNITQEAFIQLSREGVIFPRLKKLCIPLLSPFPNLLYECLSGILPALEEIENIRPNVHNTCDPLRCQAYFKKSSMKVLHDTPVSSYGRISKSLPDASDKQKRVRWESDLAKTAISCNHVEEYHCMRGSGYMDDKGMERLSVLFPGLKVLELQHCSITDEGFAKMFTYNRSGGVTAIILDKPGDVSDKSLKVIADNCPNLARLKVSRCDKVTNVGINYVAYKCSKLVEFHLNNSSQSSNPQKSNNTEDVDNICLTTIGKNCSALETFALHNTSAVTSEGLSKIQSGCTGLRHLTLSECHGIDDTCVDVLKELQMLRSISLINCSKFSPKGVANLLIQVPDLHELVLFCNHKSFLADVAPLAEEAYTMLSSEMGRFKLNMLDSLVIQGVGGTFLRLVTVLCSQVTSLDIRCGDQINSEDLIEVVTTCEHLVTLDLSQSMVKLTDAFLRTVGHHSHHLEYLSLGPAVKTNTQEALVQLIKVAPSLRSLTMDTSETQVDEAYLKKIIEQYRGEKCYLNVDNQAAYRLVQLHFNQIKCAVTKGSNWPIK